MIPADHLDALRIEGTRIGELPTDGLTAPVEACPGWDVERLVSHVSRVHRWVTAVLAAGPDATVDRRQLPQAPTGPPVLDFYREGFDALLAELSAHDPHEPAWTFFGEGTADFWYRRQAHEAAVHRWDGQHALGEAISIEPALAADGIDEFLAVFLARLPAADPDDLGRAIRVQTTDVDSQWLLRLTEAGIAVERATGEANPATDATVSAPASDQLLVWWRRLPRDAAVTTGDVELVERLLDRARF